MNQSTSEFGRDSTDERSNPDWFDSFVVSVVLVLLGVTVVGLVTAIVGVMTPLLVTVGVLLWCLLALAIVWTSVSVRGKWRISAAGAVAMLVVVGVTILNLKFAAEHVLTDRDPGVYITTARWLATRGTLLVDGATSAFAGFPGIDGSSQGHYAIRADGIVYTQFQHGLAVVLAVARWIGGDWLLFKSVGLLSGGVIATFYVFSRTVLRSGWALAATVGVAANLVVLHFGRDAYSELLLMIFLYGGLWFLHRALELERPWMSLLAGLVLGGTAMVRIDAWMILAGLFAFLFLDAWMAGERWQQRIAYVTAPILAGIAITGGLGVVDLLVASPQYLRDLLPNVYRIAAVLLGVVAGGLLVSIFARPWRWLADPTIGRRRRMVGTGIAVAVLIGSAFLYFVRPVLLVERSSAAVDVVEYLQRLQGIPLDGTRRYWELSMQWQAWYLGIVGLVVGVVGWAWTAREVVVGRARRMAPFFFMFSLVTVAFLWRPANTPDHLWMMRRFLSITIPGFILLGFYGLQSWVPAMKLRWRRMATTIATGVLVVAMLVPPMLFSAPLARSSTQVGMLGITNEVCSAMGRDAAVLVLSKRLRSVYEPALRAFCEIPAAGSAELPTIGTLRALADAWTDAGRELFVVTLPNESCGVAPVFERFIWYPVPERTLTRRPAGEVDARFGVAVYSAFDFLGLGMPAWSACVDVSR